MKPALHNPKYLIAIALTVLLCITGIVFFIGKLLDQRIARISATSGDNVSRQKANVFSYEFDNLLKGSNIAVSLYSDVEIPDQHKDLHHTLSTLLLSDEKVNRAWYTIIKGKDTTFVAVTRLGAGYVKTAMSGYLKAFIKAQFLKSEVNFGRGTVINYADSLHWISSSRVIHAKGARLMVGMDINLKELQRSFYNIDPRGVAYAFIVDENGICIYNPNEKLIGTKIFNRKQLAIASSIKPDLKLPHEKAISEYLGVPVERYYMLYPLNGMKCTIVVDIPAFAIEEDVAAIRMYSIYMGLIAVGIILSLIVLYQRKWQKEFLLRRQVEINRQELSMEKQNLSLLTERQQKENALLQLNKLKEKVNPHFLFNSLSSLNALIAQDPELAKSFVVKLSRVYRYVLESYPNGLATVAEELRFVNEYFFLLKIRFGEALEPLELHLSDAHLQEKIPFMSLQTLIENAVKHNILSKSKPLHISIKSEGNHIIVSNNLQLRNDVRDSGKQGLNYLQSTYAYFGNQALKYGIEGEAYKCYLPVLDLTE